MKEKKKLNLLPQEIKNKYANKYLIYAVSAVCGIFILALSVQYINIGILNHSIHKIQKENERYSEEKAKMETLQSSINKHKDFLENYKDKSFPFSNFMYDLELNRPYSVSIISVDSKDRLVNEGVQEKNNDKESDGKTTENNAEKSPDDKQDEQTTEKAENTENDSDDAEKKNTEEKQAQGKIEYLKDLTGEEISIRGYGSSQEDISKFIYSISKFSYIKSAKIAAIEQRELEGNLVNVFEILVIGGAEN